MRWEESTTWFAVGASAAAFLLLIAVLVLARRVRALGVEQEAGRNAPVGGAVVADLTDALERAKEDAARAELESRQAREEGERAKTELRWLRHLGDIGAVDLEGIVQRALEAATRLAQAAGGMIVLSQGEEEPLVATFGLSPDESSRELLGMPPEGGQARAVTLAYRYSEDEIEHDEFRLRGGLAVPVLDERGDRIGTLAIFWRRVEREITDEALLRLEALTAALAPALENAFRFEELRRLADLDPVTGLRNRRYLHEALARECARARRYERRLSLVLVRVDVPPTAENLTAAGDRILGALRGADLVCHLDEGRFALVLPEAALADAERLYRRLQFAVGSGLGGNGRIGLPAGIVELRPEDDPVSLLERAQAALERDEKPDAFGRSTAVEPRS